MATSEVIDGPDVFVGVCVGGEVDVAVRVLMTVGGGVSVGSGLYVGIGVEVAVGEGVDVGRTIA